MGVYRTLVYKMHYKWPVYRWRYTGRIPYTMKNIRGVYIFNGIRVYRWRYVFPYHLSRPQHVHRLLPVLVKVLQVHTPLNSESILLSAIHHWCMHSQGFGENTVLLTSYQSCMHLHGLGRKYCSVYFLLKTTIHITNSGLLQQTDIQQHFSDQSNYPSAVKVYHLSSVAPGSHLPPLELCNRA